MKKNRLIWLLSFILVILVATTTGVTIAWITQLHKTPDISYEVGKIDYEIYKNPSGVVRNIVPGQNICNFDIINNSNISTNLRIIIVVALTPSGSYTRPGSFGIINGDKPDNFTDHIVAELSPQWVFDDINDTIYYKSFNDFDGKIQPKTNPSSPFQRLSINGYAIDNYFENAKASIFFTFQVKQSDNITWETIGKINWNSGN